MNILKELLLESRKENVYKTLVYFIEISFIY